MYTRIFRIFYRFPGTVDIRLGSPTQSGNHRPLDAAGDGFDRLKIPGGCDRETCFDHINPQARQLLGDFNFFFHIETDSGRLFAVPQSSIKKIDPVFIVHCYQNLF